MRISHGLYSVGTSYCFNYLAWSRCNNVCLSCCCTAHYWPNGCYHVTFHINAYVSRAKQACQAWLFSVRHSSNMVHNSIFLFFPLFFAKSYFLIGSARKKNRRRTHGDCFIQCWTPDCIVEEMTMQGRITQKEYDRWIVHRTCSFRHLFHQEWRLWRRW